jgi:hypothetical protein
MSSPHTRIPHLQHKVIYTCLLGFLLNRNINVLILVLGQESASTNFRHPRISSFQMLCTFTIVKNCSKKESKD